MIIEVHPIIMEDGFVNDGLVKHYSDKNVYLLQVETGAKYADPVDVYPCPYTYEETDEDINDTINYIGKLECQMDESILEK